MGSDMWLMTRHGFYSIVQKDDGIHIRAREREDLERMLKGMGVRNRNAECALGAATTWKPTDTIMETPHNDYRWRIVVNQAFLNEFMNWLAKTCDYPNFKAQIDSDPAQRRKPYHEVWAVIARALGAYGRKGEA